MTRSLSLVHAVIGLSVVTSAARAERSAASLGDRDVRRYLASRGLVTLCGDPSPDSVDLQPVDLQPGDRAPGAPCLVQGDFDADGANDIAVLVAERRGRRRAGVLVKAAGKLTLFGAGARTPWRFYDEEREAFIRRRSPADLEARASLRTYAWRGAKPPEAAGATLALDGGDATLAIFSDGRAWYAMPLGF